VKPELFPFLIFFRSIAYIKKKKGKKRRKEFLHGQLVNFVIGLSQNGKQEKRKEKEKVEKKTHVDNSAPLFCNTYFTTIPTLSDPKKLSFFLLMVRKSHSLSLQCTQTIS